MQVVSDETHHVQGTKYLEFTEDASSSFENVLREATGIFHGYRHQVGTPIPHDSALVVYVGSRHTTARDSTWTEFCEALARGTRTQTVHVVQDLRRKTVPPDDWPTFHSVPVTLRDANVRSKAVTVMLSQTFSSERQLVIAANNLLGRSTDSRCVLRRTSF
jgi:hypothetical protein